MIISTSSFRIIKTIIILIILLLLYMMIYMMSVHSSLPLTMHAIHTKVRWALMHVLKFWLRRTQNGPSACHVQESNRGHWIFSPASCQANHRQDPVKSHSCMHAHASMYAHTCMHTRAHTHTHASHSLIHSLCHFSAITSVSVEVLPNIHIYSLLVC